MKATRKFSKRERPFPETPSMIPIISAEQKSDSNIHRW